MTLLKLNRIEELVLAPERACRAKLTNGVIMSFAKNTIAIAFLGLSLSSTGVFAQVGGADVPSDAKKQGTMQNGSSSTGMSKGEANAPSASENKPTATGGQPGGAAGGH